MAFTKVSAALNAVLAVVFVAVVLRHNSYNNAEQLSSALATRAAITPRVMVAHVPRAFAPQVVGCKQTNLRRHQASPSMRSLLVHAGVSHAPPPVADTTQKFHGKFKLPLPMIFASFVTRLLTEQHFVRYNRRYSYNPIFALGVCSVFDQVFESLGEEKKTQLFDAFINSLSESPAQYRSDQASLEEWAKSKSAADIAPKADGDSVEQVLAEVAAGADNFLYSKFFSIGLFRMLELTGAKDPKALENLVTSLNLRMDPVIRDLNYYKSSLSALIQAQELKRESEARAAKKREEAAAKKTEAIKKMASKQM